jgi:hypothetical protein
MEARTLMSIATRQISGLILVFTATACGGCGSPPSPQPIPAPMPPPSVPVAPAPPPQAGPCDQAQLLASSTSMQARAAAEAPGTKPEGVPLCGVAAEGQTVVGPVFILEPGVCYTFLGQSLPPVGQMEMTLLGDASGMIGGLLPPNMAGMASMAQTPLLVSTTPGERVSMGERRSCYQGPPGAPVRLVLKARAGSGPMAAQVFKKKI